MSFLDNLENNLKSLESQEERDPAARQRAVERAAAGKANTLAAAPYAREIKQSKFTADLLDHATRMGYAARIKVQIAWIENTLRLQARDLRLELRPTPDGVVAVMSDAGKEVSAETVNLAGNAEVLAKRWLSLLKT